MGVFIEIIRNVSEATPSARVPSIRYVASGNNAEHFGKELFALATNSGIYWKLSLSEWIWKLADEYDVEIVEMHAKSHLYGVATHRD